MSDQFSSEVEFFETIYKRHRWPFS